jgi:hypothetical protein
MVLDVTALITHGALFLNEEGVFVEQVLPATVD